MMAAGAACHAVFLASFLIASGTNPVTKDTDATSLVQLSVNSGGGSQQPGVPTAAAVNEEGPPVFSQPSEYEPLEPYSIEEGINILRCITGQISCEGGTRASAFKPGEEHSWPEYPCLLPGVPCTRGKAISNRPNFDPNMFTIGQTPPPGMPDSPLFDSPAGVLGRALEQERTTNGNLLQSVIQSGASLTNLKVGSEAAKGELNHATTEYQQWYMQERRLDSVEAQELTVEHEYFIEEETCKHEKTKLQIEVKTEMQKLQAKKAVLAAVANVVDGAPIR